MRRQFAINLRLVIPWINENDSHLCRLRENTRLPISDQFNLTDDGILKQGDLSCASGKAQTWLVRYVLTPPQYP